MEALLEGLSTITLALQSAGKTLSLLLASCPTRQTAVRGSLASRGWSATRRERRWPGSPATTRGLKPHEQQGRGRVQP